MFPDVRSWIMFDSLFIGPRRRGRGGRRRRGRDARQRSAHNWILLAVHSTLFILLSHLNTLPALAYSADGLGLSAATTSGESAPVIREHPNSLVVKRHEPVTLACKATGTPAPTIEWYKDGERVRETANRIVLTNGDLFILNVMNSKKEKDTGVYHCLAKNVHGKTRSRNATLEMASIKDEFRILPKNVWASVNEVAVLECSPPRGFPEPTVLWRKDGDLVVLGDRFHMSDANLVISSVLAQDAGRYQCIAKNMAGVRESSLAQLSVRVKPYFIRKPEDVTAILNEEAEIVCKVGGDPVPNVNWRREHGQAISERAIITEDKSIKIVGVTKDDEGVYICEADNAVGRIAGMATLAIHSRPMFIVEPKDVKVRLNGVARFDCQASGNPRPSTFWTKEGNQNLMFPDNKYGRSTVTADGSLIISPVKKEDVGYYICSALSVVSSSTSKAHLNVTSAADNAPPPIIILGPTDRVVSERTLVQLPCEATGSPQPTIEWTFKNQPISDGNFPTFSILPGGTLQIQDVKYEDSGEYKCIVNSETGQASWSASLRVVPQHSYRPHNTFELYPDPPSRPNIVNVTEHTVTISWKPTGVVRNGTLSFVVEHYSPDLSSEWTRSAEGIAADVHTVRGLKSGARYYFLVRSKNTYGIVGPPSPLSYEAKTLESTVEVSKTHWNDPMELMEARHRLESIVVELTDVQAISSTSVRLLWNVRHGLEYIEGFYVRYRVLDTGGGDLSAMSLGGGGGEHKYNMVTVYNGGASSYVLDQLPKFTRFEFFLVPFYKTVDGKPSNTRTVSTLEDAPTAGPTSIKIQSRSVNSALISWQPPPRHQLNGILRGYNLFVQGSYIAYSLNVTLPPDTTAYLLLNLTTETEYVIQIYAFSSVGRGPSSEPLIFIMDPLLANDVYSDRSSVIFELSNSNYWIFVFVTSVLILLFIAFCASLLIFKRRKLMLMKGANVPQINTQLNFKDGDFFCSQWDDKMKRVNHNPMAMLSGGPGGAAAYQQRDLSAYRTSTSDEQTEYAEVSQQENNYETAYYATSSSMGGDDGPVAYASSSIISAPAMNNNAMMGGGGAGAAAGGGTNFRPNQTLNWNAAMKPTNNRNNFYTIDRGNNKLAHQLKADKGVNGLEHCGGPQVQPLIGHSANDYEDASVFYDSISNVTQISPSKLMANTYRYGSLSRPNHNNNAKYKQKLGEPNFANPNHEMSQSIMLNNKHKADHWETSKQQQQSMCDSSFSYREPNEPKPSSQISCHIITNPVPERTQFATNQKTSR